MACRQNGEEVLYFILVDYECQNTSNMHEEILFCRSLSECQPQPSSTYAVLQSSLWYLFTLLLFR